MASKVDSTQNVTLRSEQTGEEGGELDSGSAGEALGQLVTVLHVYGVRVSLWAVPRLAVTPGGPGSSKLQNADAEFMGGPS